MARLPVINGDDNAWGQILNDYLLVSHNDDGTQKDSGALTLPLNIGDKFLINENGSIDLQGDRPDCYWLRATNASDNEVFRFNSRGGYSFNDSDGNLLGALGSDGYFELGTGEIYSQLVFQQLQSLPTLMIQGPGEMESNILSVVARTGGETTSEVFFVDSFGGTAIAPFDDDVALAITASDDQSQNLQEWRDNGGNPLAWIAADGTPGGSLAGSGSGTSLPVGDPDLFSIDSSTYDNEVTGSGSYTTALFAQEGALLVGAQSGDDFPRWLITSDSTDGIYMGDGSYDPYDEGVNLYLASNSNRGNYLTITAGSSNHGYVALGDGGGAIISVRGVPTIGGNLGDIAIRTDAPTGPEVFYRCITAGGDGDAVWEQVVSNA